ncbi:hypothetical protein ACFV42_23640 [Streptomyces solisilvae]|uniref:hypothetical protein n=1 Tax=Streptomyces malaysiensis TaxID=92644 RepID=UPI00368E0611
MNLFPGTRPIHGDSVHLSIGANSLLITGDIVCQGVHEDGRGYVELTLPDGDPEQRRAAKRHGQFGFDLYRGGGSLYASPTLTLISTRRTSTGALVLRGAP